MSRKPKPLTNSPARWRAIEKKYGLTEQRYKEILQEQGGVCYICQRSPFEIRKRQWLSVDHCHKSGQVRDLLCGACNLVLGHIEKYNIPMENVIAYLQKWPELPNE